MGLPVLLLGCTSPTESGEERASEPAAPVSVETTTTTIGPMPPEIRIADRARAEVGQVFSDAIVVVDPNGDTVAVEVARRTPDGFTVSTSPRGLITGFEWRPTRAGEWTVDVTATDEGGLETVQTLTLVSRYPRQRDLLVAMGDSVAAGFGRDRSDFSGSDECFRSEGDAYGALVAAQLIEAGALSADADTMIVACAGATAASLRGVEVEATDESGDRFGGSGSQLDLAVQANPTIITLTIGTTDVSLFDARGLIETGAGENPDVARDVFSVDHGLDALDQNLRLALDTLVESTDAHIAITTLYNPTAASPFGVEGCEAACFAAVMGGVVEDLNAVIIEAADDQPAGRVSVARLDGEADVWEASNGFGPDALRDLGPLQDVVDVFTGGSSATCARTGAPEVALVSTLDCAHPNEEGHQEIARIVASLLLEL